MYKTSTESIISMQHINKFTFIHYINLSPNKDILFKCVLIFTHHIHNMLLVNLQSNLKTRFLFTQNNQ